MLRTYQKTGILLAIVLCIVALVAGVLHTVGTGTSLQALFFRSSQKDPFTITSSVFNEGGQIPTEYTCEGKNVNPPIEISNIPEGTRSLAILIDDPDATIGSWTHWLIWNIDPNVDRIDPSSVPEGAEEGTNDFGVVGYGGPCPPGGEHHYRFVVYALDVPVLDLESTVRRPAAVRAFRKHEIEKAILTGLYRR